MNKKFMSFVLAMVLCVGLGVSASARVELGGAGEVLGTGGGDSGRTTIGFTITNESMKRFADSELGNLVTTFGYAAGQMTYQASKTAITYIDANGMKSAFSVTQDATTGEYNYTMTSIVLSGTDIAAIQAAGGLKNFLLQCGMSEDALKTVMTDGEGNILTQSGEVTGSTDEAGMQDAGWLTDGSVDNWLAQGIGFSATISLGGNDPQVTLSENGKPSYVLGTYGGKSYIATEYVYDKEDGHCIKSINATLQAQSGQDGTTYGIEYSVTVMDEFGRADHTYLTSTRDGEATEYEKTRYNAETQSYDKTGEKASGWTTQYHYTANGTMDWYEDFTSGNKYIFAAGQMDRIKNAEGGTVAEYIYHNNIMTDVLSYNGSTIVSRTVFDDFGRNLGTVQGTSDNGHVYTHAEAVSAVMDVLTGRTNLNTNNGAAGCIVQSVQVYKDYLGVYNGFLSQNDNINLTALASKTYGYNTAIGNINIATTGFENAEPKKGGASTTTEEGQKSLAGTYKIKVNGKEKTITIENDKDIAALSYDDAVALCKAAGISTNNIRKVKNYKSGAKDSSYTIYVGSDSDAKKVLSALGIEAGSRDVKHVGVGSYLLGVNLSAAKKTTTVSAATASLSFTCYAQGIAYKSATTYLGQKTTTTESAGGYQAMDPAVAGTYLGTYTDPETGHTYAIVGDAEMNVLDGEDFHALGDEVIYVDITGNEDVVKDVAKGGKVMFMGKVAQDVDGHFVVAMEKSFGGGFVDGSKFVEIDGKKVNAIDAMKQEITQTAQRVAMAKDAYELGEITEAQYNQIVEESGWVGTNTDANLEAFEKGNFRWDDQNKSVYDNLKDVYSALGVAINF